MVKKITEAYVALDDTVHVTAEEAVKKSLAHIGVKSVPEASVGRRGLDTLLPLYSIECILKNRKQIVEMLEVLADEQDAVSCPELPKDAAKDSVWKTMLENSPDAEGVKRVLFSDHVNESKNDGRKKF